MLKGKNTFKLLIALGVLVGVYAIVQLTSGSGRSKSYREVLVDLDTAKVTKVEVIDDETTTVLEKGENGWSVNGDKKAMESSVKGLLSSLNTIEPSRLASRSKDTWQDFQVDSSGLEVKVYEGGSEALDLIIGRFGVEGQRAYYTYVRLAEDNDTYVAANFMGISIGKTDADFRDPNIMRLKKDSIQSVDFNYPEGTYTLSKGDDGKWSMAGVEADSTNVANFISALTYVSSKKFEDDEVTSSDKEVTIRLGGEDDITLKSYGDGILSSSKNEAEVFNDKTAYDKVFKSPEFFTSGS